MSENVKMALWVLAVAAIAQGILYYIIFYTETDCCSHMSNADKAQAVAMIGFFEGVIFMILVVLGMMLFSGSGEDK